MAGVSIHFVNVLLMSSLGHGKVTHKNASKRPAFLTVNFNTTSPRLSLLISIAPAGALPFVCYADITKPPATRAAVFLNLVEMAGVEPASKKEAQNRLLS
jgi:hypothetical protein